MSPAERGEGGGRHVNTAFQRGGNLLNPGMDSRKPHRLGCRKMTIFENMMKLSRTLTVKHTDTQIFTGK